MKFLIKQYNTFLFNRKVKKTFSTLRKESYIKDDIIVNRIIDDAESMLRASDYNYYENPFLGEIVVEVTANVIKKLIPIKHIIGLDQYVIMSSSTDVLQVYRDELGNNTNTIASADVLPKTRMFNTCIKLDDIAAISNDNDRQILIGSFIKRISDNLVNEIFSEVLKRIELMSDKLNYPDISLSENNDVFVANLLQEINEVNAKCNRSEKSNFIVTNLAIVDVLKKSKLFVPGKYELQCDALNFVGTLNGVKVFTNSEINDKIILGYCHGVIGFEGDSCVNDAGLILVTNHLFSSYGIYLDRVSLKPAMSFTSRFGIAENRSADNVSVTPQNYYTTLSISYK